MAGGASHPGRTGGPGHRRGRLSPEAELAALRARVAALQTENDELVAEQAKLVTEGEILRRAAKYFAGETNW
jgi:transposase